MAKCVIIAAENLASNGVVSGLLEGSGKHIQQLILLPNFPLKSPSNRGRAKRLIDKTVWQFVMFKGFEIFVSSFIRLMLNSTISAKARKRNIPIAYFSDPSDPVLVDYLSSMECDIILSAGPSILPQSILSIPSLFTLNCHCARLPEFQGPANYIWMSIEQTKYAYVAIQIMTAKIDAGEVIAEDYIVRDPTWSVYEFNWHLAKFAGGFYSKVLNTILNADSLTKIQLKVDRSRQHVEKNRGFPKSKDFIQLRKRGVRLIRLLDPLRFF